MSSPRKILGQSKLDQRVTADANKNAIAPSRAKRWVAAAALFEVLNCAEEERKLGAYAIKGGFAVELRHSRSARTSKDIDLILAGEKQAIEIFRALMPAKWDAFDFRIKTEQKLDHVINIVVPVRFNLVDWCTITVEVMDGEINEVERVDNIAIERFGLPQARPVSCISRPQQISEWIHCTTKPEIDGKRKNRARNIVDLYLFDTLAPADDGAVRAACRSTFEREKTHGWPAEPNFPELWLETVADVIQELEMDASPQAVVEHVSNYIRRLGN